MIKWIADHSTIVSTGSICVAPSPTHTMPNLIPICQLGAGCDFCFTLSHPIFLSLQIVTAWRHAPIALSKAQVEEEHVLVREAEEMA